MDRIEHKLHEIEHKLDWLMEGLKIIYKKEVKVMASLMDLEAQVKATTDAEASAILLIQGLVAQLVAAGTDPAALQKLTDDLRTSADALAASVIANT